MSKAMSKAMSGMSDSPVSGAKVDEFQQHGVTVLRGVFVDWVDSLQRGVERNMADPGPYTKGYTPEGGSGRFFGDYCNWQRIPEYEEFVRHSTAGAIAGRLMQSQQARFFHEHVLVKEPGTAEATPWHHDYPYYGIDGTKSCSLWIPLDAVPEAPVPSSWPGPIAGAVGFFRACSAAKTTSASTTTTSRYRTSTAIARITISAPGPSSPAMPSPFIF